MAITSFDMSCDKIRAKPSGSAHSSKRSNSCKPSAVFKCSKSNKKNSRSPYLIGDRGQLFSRVIERRFINKKTSDIVSSFPLSVNLYKANSDEIKSSKKARKVKKSVLTLPNELSPVPQVCTVSDMNDSEYCYKIDENRKRNVIKKRGPIQNNRKTRIKEKDFEYYDRDAQYCSQRNINFDCSATDMMKHFNGNSKMVSNRKKKLTTYNKPQTASNNLSDVWALLRNMNRLQFRPSPSISDESLITVKKNIQKSQNKRKDTRVIETCRTEKLAFISSYELGKKSAGSFAPSSSPDRITVIDKQNEYSKIYKQFEKRLLGIHGFHKDSNNTKSRIQKIKTHGKILKSNVRALDNAGAKENKQLIPLKMKRKTNFKPTVDQKSKIGTTISSRKRVSLIDLETLHCTNDETENDSIIPSKGSFTSSNHLGSSKAELFYKVNEQDSRKDKSADVAVLSKEQKSTVNLDIPKRFDHRKRKPRLVTTMPSSYAMPKLTLTEIKRRLANIRFPIVVLGKDQVSSGIQVMDCDPPQFNGLNNHIWPFMTEWSPNATKGTKHDSNTLSRKFHTYLLDANLCKSRKANTEVGTYKQTASKEMRLANNYSTTNKKKAEIKRPTPSSELTNKLFQCSNKQKSIEQLKDKMLSFLYKKSSIRNAINDNNCQNDENIPKNSAIAEYQVPTTTDTQLKPVLNILVPKDLPKRRAFPVIGKNKNAQNCTYPWAKGKWASEFIENVIKKIRSGVYYTQDHKDFYDKYQIDLKEVSAQAGALCDSSDSTQNYNSDIDFVHDVTLNTSRNNVISIPGFNNTLPLLEIKTLNTNQIAVKHCMTNVMVQFDVTVPAKRDQGVMNLTRTSSLIPIEIITENHTKVYKCKTTILNAMLPAELCSILPKMISNIIDSNKSSEQTPTITDSSLPIISELAGFENIDSSGIITSSHTLSEMKEILEGRFSNKAYKKPFSNKVDLRINDDLCLVTEFLPKVWLNDLFKYKVSPLVVKLDNSQYKKSQISLRQSNKQILGVTNIQNLTSSSVKIYTGSNERLSLAFKTNYLMGMIESLVRHHNLLINLNLCAYFDMLKLQYDGKNIKINMSMANNEGVQKKISVTVSNLNIASLNKGFPKLINNNENNLINRSNIPLKCIEYNNTSLASKSENTELTQVTSNKTKRKGFCKIYRKCKSTTNIPSVSGEKIKCTNTPLNKITTLDDFFQILGSKKMLSSVFDGYAAKKILSSLMEMKNWITEINPKQALLILLLINKKDTENLVRFRSLILQGIAVSRITRASELDMEIEVIDRENLNQFSEFEGITYLPESVTNYENLLEELYWIAKTTASDYKKPFDETSERLLKSLLQKRKKLNPSYLRVMARYVGLGLVKMQTKC